MTALHRLHPALTMAADAAHASFHEARRTRSRAELEATDGIGADGTETMVLDRIVDAAVLTSIDGAGVNLLSGGGWVDAGSVVTLVVHHIMDLAATIPIARACGVTVVDAFDRAIEVDADLTRRWSGIVAATPALAREIQVTIRAG